MAVLTKITGRSLADNAVTSSHVQGDVIAAGDLAPNPVGASELADDAVDTAAIADDAVTNTSIADGAIDSAAKLGSSVVTTVKIADSTGGSDGITTAKLATDAVTSAKIATGAVIADGIGAGAVVAAGLGASAVTKEKIAAEAIEVKPHIKLDLLYPALKDTGGTVRLSDGATAHSGAYGTTQSDGRKYYYTDIKGSKPIKDPRIGAHFGSQRFQMTSVQILEQETALQGRNVCSIDGREYMRGVGTISMANNSYGNYIDMEDDDSPMAFIEVVGYFNDANISLYTSTNLMAQCAVNGGSLGSDLGTSSIDSPLGGRYVHNGSLINTGITATLGINTLRIEPYDSNGHNTKIHAVELIAQDTQDFTATNATNILTSAGHTLTNGDQIRLTGADLPNGLNATTTYYVISVSGNNFQVSASLGGSAVTFSDDGSGSRTFTSLNNIQIPAQNVVSYGKKFSVSATAEHYNPFAFKTDGSTAWASGAHNGTSWPVGTGACANIDTATSLGLENWKHSNNYYKPYNGGRVVKWVDSSGNIKTSVTVMPPNARSIKTAAISAKANASIANNTPLPTFEAGAPDDFPTTSLTEIARTYHWREFGNGSANQGHGGSQADATVADTAAHDFSFVLDDGLTHLHGDDCLQYASAGTNLGMGVSTTGDGWWFTFIGTGVNVKTPNGTNMKLAQNLPYGSHAVKLLYSGGGTGGAYTIDGVAIDNSNSSNDWWSQEWLSFYQPKMPPIPEDACILADYMLMADHVNKTANIAGVSVAKGVRLLDGSRDFWHNCSSGSMLLNNYAIGDGYPFRNYMNSGSGAKLSKIPAFGTSFGIDQLAAVRNDTHVAGSAVAHTDVGVHTHINTPVALGNNIFAAQAASGQDGGFFRCEIAIPTHTSSHYQEFETPFLHELVGGDRNMEQNNLIVTADGKSWDEVTRDTSYIGNTIVNLNGSQGSNIANNTAVQFKLNRGAVEQNYHFLKKYFVMAYDRVICLIEGEYKISYATICGTALQQSTFLQINGTACTSLYTSGAPAASYFRLRNECPIFLKRGDFIQINGGHWDGTNVQHQQFTIDRLR